MASVACGTRNSFALDNNGDLYTWGSYESGLLGKISDCDIESPSKIEVRDSDVDYSVESIDVGQFHAGIIAKRKDINLGTSFENLKTLGKSLFDPLRTWFESHIKVCSVKDLILLLIKHSPTQNEVIYDEFEEYFLEPYFAYLTIKGRRSSHMKENFYDAAVASFNISQKNKNFLSDKLDNLAQKTDFRIAELYKFASMCFNHFSEHPEDIQFFCRIIFRFKRFITESDINRLLGYAFKDERDIEANAGEKRILLEKLAINEKIKATPMLIERHFSSIEKELLKTVKFIEANTLIDIIIGKDTRNNNVFTWGINEEDRLGYRDIDIVGELSKENKGEMKIEIQYTPKIVYFEYHVRIVQISCGFFHSLALSEKGEAYAWGSSKFGCLGKYYQSNQNSPRKIITDDKNQVFNNIVKVAAGMYFSLALNKDGEVYSWGLGNNGLLGHNNENSFDKPTKIEFFSNEERKIKIQSITCGDMHSAAISINKELYTWGNGNYGKLGHCNYEHALIPTKVDFFSQMKINQVVCGSFNTVAITSSFKVYCWGKNSHGMLGLGKDNGINVLIPQEILYQKDDSGIIVNKIALGSMHLLFLCNNGKISSCGNSICGVLGIDNITDKISLLAELPDIDSSKFKLSKKIGGDDFQSVSEGYSQEYTIIPRQSVSNESIIQVETGHFNTSFITNKGEVYITGQKDLIPINEENAYKESSSELTIADDKYIYRIDFFKDRVTNIALSKYHAICICKSQSYAWGYNNYGILGLIGKADKELVKTPTLIESLKIASVMVCVSNNHSMILCNNGEIFAFGNNMFGKLGTGTIEKYNMGQSDQIPHELEPIPVMNITDASYIACSNYHSACIMKYSSSYKLINKIYTWGNGLNGKLGNGSSEDIYTPILVEELAMKQNNEAKRILYFVKVACGDEFTLALDETGQLYGWGLNAYLPGTKNKEGKTNKPIMIEEGTKFKYINARYNLACAITVSGDFYLWGDYISEDQVITIPFKSIPKKYNYGSVGFNNYSGIDSQNYVLYTWGSNLYAKCGYEKLTEDVNEYITAPRRVERVYDYFHPILEKNEQRKVIKVSKQNQEGEEENETYEVKYKLQSTLLDEPKSSKNIALMIEDGKINDLFFSTIAKSLETFRIIENKKNVIKLEVQDKIISIIRASDSMTNKKFSSSLPMIISKNFKLYEEFVKILQSHPCYLEKYFEVTQDISNFLDVFHTIFGKNETALKSPRILNQVTGLWNALFKKIDKYDNSTDSILYKLYEILYNVSEVNINMAYEIITLFIIEIVSQIYIKRYIKIDKSADPIVNQFLTMSNNEKKEIITKAINDLENYLINLFELTKSKENVCYDCRVLWILKQFVKRYKKKKTFVEEQKKINRILNTYLFNPCLNILKKIMNGHKDQLPKEYFGLTNYLLDSLTKPSMKKLFSEFLNSYKVKRGTEEESFFKDLCGNSLFLKVIYDILDDIINEEGDIDVKEQNEQIIECLNSYNYDFTTSSIKDFFGYLVDKGNSENVVPIVIGNIVKLQSSFLKIIKSLGPKDPLNILLSELKELSLEDLDIGSSINSMVVNLYISPYSFYYDNQNSYEMIKCKDCQLPLPDLFLEENQKYLCKVGKPWKCRQCGVQYEDNVYECKTCNTFKKKSDGTNENSYFKKFYVKEQDKNVLKYEEALQILPSLNADDNLLFECTRYLNKLRDSKDKEKLKDKILVLEYVKNMLNNHKDQTCQDKVDPEFTREIEEKVTKNINHRKKHIDYLFSIGELIDFIDASADKAKINFSFYVEKIQKYTESISNGNDSNVFNNNNRLFINLKEIKASNKNEQSKKSISSTYLVKDLIAKDVIQEILFDGKDRPELIQKCFLYITKYENGFKFILNFKENIKKMLVCNNKINYKLKEFEITSEQLLYIRRNARHNLVYSFEEISFNSFNLVILLNNLIPDIYD